MHDALQFLIVAHQICSDDWDRWNINILPSILTTNLEFWCSFETLIWYQSNLSSIGSGHVKRTELKKKHTTAEKPSF